MMKVHHSKIKAMFSWPEKLKVWIRGESLVDGVEPLDLLDEKQGYRGKSWSELNVYDYQSLVTMMRIYEKSHINISELKGSISDFKTAMNVMFDSAERL